MLSRHIKISWRQLLGAALIVSMVGLVWIALAGLGLNPHEFHTKVSSLNPILTFGLMALLPIFGFSIGVVYVIAGARFGSELGIVLITFATAVHLIGSYWIAKSFLRTRI